MDAIKTVLPQDVEAEGYMCNCPGCKEHIG